GQAVREKVGEVIECGLSLWPSADLDDLVACGGGLFCGLANGRGVFGLAFRVGDDRGGEHAEAQGAIKDRLKLVQECLILNRGGEVTVDSERGGRRFKANDATCGSGNSDGATAIGTVGGAHQSARDHRRRTTRRTTWGSSWPDRVIHRGQVARFGIDS